VQKYTFIITPQELDGSFFSWFAQVVHNHIFAMKNFLCAKQGIFLAAVNSDRCKAAGYWLSACEHMFYTL
jgi:hypothetical protein